MERHYYKEHSFGSGLRKVVLKVFNKREIRKIDSLVPYCDMFVNGKPKGTIRVNERGNNKQTYKTRELISKAQSSYVNKYYNVDVIANQNREFHRGFT
jgi:hypothetical protein